MRSVFLALICSATFAGAEDLSADLGLLSEDYTLRKEAAQKLVDWAQDGEKETKVEQLLERYFQSKEPEEQFRLAQVLYQLQKSSIPQEGEGFIGISMDRRRVGQAGFEDRGVVVTDVIVGTPAQAAGLENEDLIVEIDGQDIGGGDPTANLQAIVMGKAPGTKIKLSILRANEDGEERLKLEVPLMNRAALKQRNFWDATSAEVDLEKAEGLLRLDFQKWLSEQRVKRSQDKS